MVDLAGEILRNPPQLLFGDQAAEALHDSRDARHFRDPPAGLRADGMTLLVLPAGRAIAIPGYQGGQLIVAHPADSYDTRIDVPPYLITYSLLRADSSIYLSHIPTTTASVDLMFAKTL